MPLETKDIKGVEIFSVGTWNGDEYTMEDLNEMVKNFSELRSGLKPHLKLGHDEDQRLIQTDGLPAVGWIERLYVMGDKLVADFSQIPKTIYDLIESGGYKKVSSEIYYNLKIGEKIYNKVLAAVALLGADTPAVMNLKDILAFYKAESKDLRVYDLQLTILKESLMSKSEAELKLEFDLKQKEDELATVKSQTEKFEAEKAEFTKEIETLKSYKAKAEAEKQELLAKAEAAEKEQFMTELVSEKLMSPAMKTTVEKMYNKDLKSDLKDLLKFAKDLSTVNFDENSVEDKGKTVDKEKEQIEKAYTLSKEKGISFAQAVKQLNKQSKKE
jgi:septal ring factor EnvC (AmiA/AmiB activator)